MIAKSGGSMLNNKIPSLYCSLTSRKDYLFIDDPCGVIEKSLLVGGQHGSQQWLRWRFLIKRTCLDIRTGADG
jgi:hypothetical protein